MIHFFFIGLILLISSRNCLVMAADPPNIILMMGDDHGWEETGYNGHPHVRTPVLDRMAAEGLQFRRFYAGHPNCSPTRASFLTGRHPNRMGTFAPGWSIRPEEITLADKLAATGYRCGHFGKWHVGTVKSGSPLNPGAMGFHEWLSHDNFFELNPSLSRNGGPPQIIQGESSEILIDETISFIDECRNRKQPFLAVVWFGSPHEPYSGLPQDLALYDDIVDQYSEQVALTSNETGLRTRRPKGQVLRERYAEITAMDRSIGTLRNYLKESGLRENTVLFYCGDNGTSGESALRTPHRGVKSSVYEGGILVPGLLEWPAGIPTPQQTSVRAVTSDLLPTVCRLAGQSVPQRPLDGIDLSPIWEQKLRVRPQPLFFWMLKTSALSSSARTPWVNPDQQVGTTPLVKLSGGKPTRTFQNFRYADIPSSLSEGARAVIDGDYKLVIHSSTNGDRVELFQLANDPAETRNLKDDLPSTTAELTRKLSHWQLQIRNSLTGADYN